MPMNSIFLYGLLAAALRCGNIYSIKQKLRNEISCIKVWRFRLQISLYHFRYHAQTFPVRSWSVRFDRLTFTFSREPLHIFLCKSFPHKEIPNANFMHSQLILTSLHLLTCFFEKDVAMTSKCWTTNALKIFIVLLKGFEKSIITRAQSKFKHPGYYLLKKKTLQSPYSDMQKRRRAGYQPRCARGCLSARWPELT